MNRKILAARSEDTARMSEISFAAKAFWGYSPEFMEMAREELIVTSEKLREPDTHFFVLTEDDLIIAYSAIALLAGNCFELDALFVAPSNMGSGAGSELFQHAVRFMRERDGTIMRIVSDPNAVGFYQQMGANLEGQVPSGSIPGRYLPQLVYRVE